MFGPLAFKEDNSLSNKNDAKTSCMLCEDNFSITSSLSVYLKHIFDQHKLVIEDAQHIHKFYEYNKFWKEKFKINSIEEIIPAVNIALTDHKYFVLSTLLPEDKQLRHKLRLEYILETQEFERNDSTFAKPCLFCKYDFQGKRCDYLKHLSEQHNVWLGNAQNLVYIDELLSKIEEKLRSLHCLYCDKLFTDRNTLKEHMRKKLHKRINPSNHEYDKYYSVNYLDPDWRKSSNSQECDRVIQCGSFENSDEEYGDWKETETLITCLFCLQRETNINRICFHMNSKHQFNFYEVTKYLDFYEKVKLVNYIRRQMHRLQCIYCDSFYEDLASLETHMQKEKHYCLPDVKIYDRPEFYFPTYENDSFLYFLEEIED